MSYDPTRELYKEFNAAFAEKWQADTGETVTIQTSHGLAISRKPDQALLSGYLDPGTTLDAVEHKDGQCTPAGAHRELVTAARGQGNRCANVRVVDRHRAVRIAPDLPGTE